MIVSSCFGSSTLSNWYDWTELLLERRSKNAASLVSDERLRGADISPGHGRKRVAGQVSTSD